MTRRSSETQARRSCDASCTEKIPIIMERPARGCLWFGWLRWCRPSACIALAVGFTILWGAIGLALALAGAAGNLVDILRWRYVVDFVDLGWWPVFNLADVGIVGGLLLAFGSGL